MTQVKQIGGAEGCGIEILSYWRRHPKHRPLASAQADFRATAHSRAIYCHGSSRHGPAGLCHFNWLSVITFLLWVMCFPSLAQAGAANRLTNGDLEEAGASAGVPMGWEAFWSRLPGAGVMTVDRQVVHEGRASLRIDQTGAEDWSAAQAARLPVTAGEIYRLSGWVKCEKAEGVELSAVTRGGDGSVLSWSEGAAHPDSTQDWRLISRRFVVPPGCVTVQFRLIGSGPGHVWLDDASLVREGTVSAFQSRLPVKPLHLTNALLDVRLDAAAGTLRVTDKRIHRVWQQQPFGGGIVVQSARRDSPHSLLLTLWDAANDLNFQAVLTLSPSAPKLAVALTGQGSIQEPIAFPQPFVTGKATALVIPLDEGILYPADDAGIPPMQFTTYTGHGGLCMPWFGVTDTLTGAGLMAIIQTPDDARVELTRLPGSGLLARTEWEASRGSLRYGRSLTYVFFARGGYVAQAKNYRAYARTIGLFKTLAEKRRANPNVDLLLGAVDVWNWDMDKVALCREMKALGMDHVLWSSGGTASEVAAINQLGYLSSRYDIYQDVWPSDAPVWLHREGWPQDLVRLPGGDWMKGWADIEKNKDGTQTIYQGGVVNSERGLARARQTIPADLAATAYRCRFLDTTTASPWREDYDPAHPLTRSEDRKYKMALLAFCSDEMKQVVGTETGIDPSVPYVDYYEGMLSLAPYRLPDAGYDMIGYRAPTPEFLKYQVGSQYRIPLWELVYHDCVVANWYWGDATNKSPEVWPRRDLFNLLYATPPLFLFDRPIWEKQKKHFARTYQAVCPVARRFSTEEMLSHGFLTADHTVQQTRWASGAEIVVNFGEKPYRLPGGQSIPPLGWRLSGGGRPALSGVQ